jgi:hypothetical protein
VCVCVCVCVCMCSVEWYGVGGGSAPSGWKRWRDGGGV